MSLKTFGPTPGAVLVEIPVHIPVHEGPISSIAASPDGARLMVTNYGRDSVSVIDTDTLRVVQTVAGVNEPFAIAIGSADDDRAYVSAASAAYDSIEVIDTSSNTVIASHPLALSVSDLVVSSDGKNVYASRNGARGGDIAVLDTTTDEVEVIELGPGITTECVRVSSDGARLYVGTNGPAGGRLVVFGADAPSGDFARSRRHRKNSKGATNSTRSSGKLRVIGTVGIGLPIRDVALSADGSVAYVASSCPELGPELSVVVDVIDTRNNTIVHTSKVGEVSGVLIGLTLSGAGDRAYLVTADSITVLCTRTHDVVDTLGCAIQPSAVVESPDGELLYIADYSGTVSVVPIASKTPLAIESAAHDNDAAADWDSPELLHYEPALA